MMCNSLLINVEKTVRRRRAVPWASQRGIHGCDALATSFS